MRRNILRALTPLGATSVTQRDGRYLVRSSAPEEAVAEALSRVFGVSWFARASVVEEEHGAILKASLDALGPGGGTFRVSVKRADKGFPLNSMDLERSIGAQLASSTGRRVNLSEPSETVHVDVLRGAAIVYCRKVRGEGGLPVGSGGRVINLFSGGIDSPVAAWLMMKRGCKTVHLHFYLAPSVESIIGSKVTKIMEVLSRHGGRTNLALIPFSEYQLATASAPSDAEPSLFRRFMRMTAESLAPRFGARAISTGDNLAQAASQTLWNLGVFDAGSSLPIMRPLLTYDKEEIIQLARRIGTYDLSIQEYKDCCSIVTRHPKTRANPAVIGELARDLDFAALVEKCLSLGTLYTYDPAKGEGKAGPLPGGEGQAPELVRSQNSQNY